MANAGTATLPGIIPANGVNRMILRFFLALLLLAGILGGIFGWKYQQIKMMQDQPRSFPAAVVAATEVTETRWQPSLAAVGSMTATNGVFIANEIAGVVTRIEFRSGQSVRAGDLLVQLDDAVDRAELDGLVAEQRLAELRFRRLEQLLAQNSTSKSDYDQAEAELQAAAAAVAAKRAEIAKKALRAPFSGELGIRRIDLGQYLDAGTDIVSLQRLDPIYVDFTLPERHLGELALNQAITVTVQAFPDNTYRGQIRAIDPRINEGTRSVQVRAQLPNPNRELRPGMFAEVHVALPERDHVLVVPRTAVTFAPYGDSVFLIVSGDDGQPRVQRKQIQTGVVRNGQIEIVSGLAVGDRVVLSGQNKLRNGQAVQIDNQIELDTDAEVGPA